MTRRARSKSASVRSDLDSLKSLRHLLATKPATPPVDRAQTPAPARQAETERDDADLFRREMRGITPIDDGGRVEPERPRPAPVPRPKSPETHAPSSPPSGTRRPLTDDALFRSSMADVTPLRDSNRVELASERARSAKDGNNAVADPMFKPNPDDAPPLLPANPAQMTPEALFRHAMRGTQPIEQDNRIEHQRPAPRPEPRMSSEDEAAALRESLEAPITFEDRLDMGEEAAFLRPGLPRRVLLDLRRGRWTLQGEVDLHGYTRDEARTALGHFLAMSLQRGNRCVRVIHGKGLGSPGRVSILKQLSRGWLAQREEILAFCQAGPNQGGSGALLVLLRGSNATPRDGGN